MDWTTGIFRILATRPLDEGQSPDDHPRAIEALERELMDLAVEELGMIAWDNRGDLSDLMRRDTAATRKVEKLAKKLEKEWSRLSKDYDAVEASYIVDLSAEVPDLFPIRDSVASLSIPPGWKPVPEDDWTGIVIYVPKSLPVQGTGLAADAVPALQARILDDELSPLVDPGTTGNGILN